MSATIPDFNIKADILKLKKWRYKEMFELLEAIDPQALEKLRMIVTLPPPHYQLDTAIDLMERHFRKLRRSVPEPPASPSPPPP